MRALQQTYDLLQWARLRKPPRCRRYVLCHALILCPCAERRATCRRIMGFLRCSTMFNASVWSVGEPYPVWHA